MIKLIRWLNLVFASFVVVTFSYLNYQRDRQYSKVTTLVSVPVALTTLETLAATSTTLESGSQSNPSSQVEVENYPTTTTTTVEAQPGTSTQVEVENQPNTTTTTVEAQPGTSTQVKVENQPNTTTATVEAQPGTSTQVKVENQPVKVANKPVTPPIVQVASPPPTKITKATVDKTLTELKAKKTKEGIQITLPEKILFDFDKYYVRASAKPTLTKINQLLTYYGNPQVFIYGYTDSKGEDSYNQKLSHLRSAAVKYYFINVFKVPPTRFQTKGFGETKPIAPNSNSDGSDNPDGRQKNRRVEVIIKTFK